MPSTIGRSATAWASGRHSCAAATRQNAKPSACPRTSPASHLSRAETPPHSTPSPSDTATACRPHNFAAEHRTEPNWASSLKPVIKVGLCRHVLQVPLRLQHAFEREQRWLLLDCVEKLGGSASSVIPGGAPENFLLSSPGKAYLRCESWAMQ